jgi:hypothetical protein
MRCFLLLAAESTTKADFKEVMNSDEENDPRFFLLPSKKNAFRLIIAIAKKISAASKQSKASPHLWGIPRVFRRLKEKIIN